MENTAKTKGLLSVYLQIHEEPTSTVCGENTEFLNGRSKAVCVRSALFNKTVTFYDYMGFMVQQGERAAMVE
jgi:hypothetical protein